MFSQPSPGSSQKAPKTNARETDETLQLQTPGERAQRASKGCTRPTTLAILMLALLSPRWLGCASWCFALVLLAVVCASLLMFSVACDACGSRFSRASRSSLVRFRFLGVVCNPPRFFEKCNTLHTKTLFFEVRGFPTWSQNGSQNASKIKLRCEGASGTASGSDLGGFWTPKRPPRGSPRSAPGGPK